MGAIDYIGSSGQHPVRTGSREHVIDKDRPGKSGNLPIPLTPRVGVISLSSPLEVGAKRAPGLAKELYDLLNTVGCEVINLGSISETNVPVDVGKRLAEEHVDAIALASASWFEDYLVLDILEECDAPVLLWSVPGMETGALCGAQQLTCFLKYLGKAYQCIYGPIAEGPLAQQAVIYLRAAALKSVLRRSRIGLAGCRVKGMTHTATDEFALKKILGPRVVHFDLPGILSRAECVSDGEALPIWNKLLRDSATCNCSERDGLNSIKMYIALREAVQENCVNVAAIGCYPDLMGRVCIAASLLADEGIPVTCEGDINGSIGQIILAKLTGQPVHHGDWLEPIEDGSIILTHCGSGSFRLADSKENIVLSPVRLMHQGVCAIFPAKTGPVTMVSLIHTESGYQCALLEGEALAAPMVFPGNPVRVRLDHPTDHVLQWIHNKGTSHHWVIGYGKVAEEIRELGRIIGERLHVVEP